MPVSALVAAGVSRLTHQQIADFALRAHRDARAARRRGDHQRARELEREVEALASVIS